MRHCIIFFWIIIVLLLVFSCNGNKENKKISNDSNNSIECYKDSDCVHMPSCCHQRAMKCIPKSKAKDYNLTCDNVFCTMVCMKCTTCKCINHKCVTLINEQGCC